MRKQALTLMELCILFLLLSLGLGLLPKALPVLCTTRKIEQQMDSIRQCMQQAEGVAQVTQSDVVVKWHQTDGSLHLHSIGVSLDSHRIYPGFTINNHYGTSSITFPLLQNEHLTIQKDSHEHILSLQETPGWIQWVH